MKKNLIFLTLLISVLLVSVVSASITGYLVRGNAVIDESGYSAKILKVNRNGLAEIVVATPTGNTETVLVKEGEVVKINDAVISVSGLKRGTLFTRGGANVNIDVTEPATEQIEVIKECQKIVEDGEPRIMVINGDKIFLKSTSDGKYYFADAAGNKITNIFEASGKDRMFKYNGVEYTFNYKGIVGVREDNVFEICPKPEPPVEECQKIEDGKPVIINGNEITLTSDDKESYFTDKYDNRIGDTFHSGESGTFVYNGFEYTFSGAGENIFLICPKQPTKPEGHKHFVVNIDDKSYKSEGKFSRDSLNNAVFIEIGCPFSQVAIDTGFNLVFREDIPKTARLPVLTDLLHDWVNNKNSYAAISFFDPDSIINLDESIAYVYCAKIEEAVNLHTAHFP